MKAGDFRHRIIIQIPQRSKNTMGEWIDTFTTWQTVWAAIEPLAGSRLFQAQQANSEVTGIVRIRYLRGLLPTMRLSYEGRIFTIMSIVQPKETRNEIQIYYMEKLD